MNINCRTVKPKDKKVSQAGFWFTHTALSITSLLIMICKGIREWKAIYWTPHRLWTRHTTSCLSSHFNHGRTDWFPSKDKCPPCAQELCTLSCPFQKKVVKPPQNSSLLNIPGKGCYTIEPLIKGPKARLVFLGLQWGTQDLPQRVQLATRRCTEKEKIW